MQLCKFICGKHVGYSAAMLTNSCQKATKYGYLYISRRLPIFTTMMRTWSSSMLPMIMKAPTRYFQKLPDFGLFRASPMLRGFSNTATTYERPGVLANGVAANHAMWKLAA
jgi:hypothetical protein